MSLLQDLVRNEMVDVKGANSEALGGRRGSGRLQRGGSLQKTGAARKPRPSGQQGCVLQSAWRLLSNGWKGSKPLVMSGG